MLPSRMSTTSKMMQMRERNETRVICCIHIQLLLPTKYSLHRQDYKSLPHLLLGFALVLKPLKVVPSSSSSTTITTRCGCPRCTLDFLELPADRNVSVPSSRSSPSPCLVTPSASSSSELRNNGAGISCLEPWNCPFVLRVDVFVRGSAGN